MSTTPRPPLLSDEDLQDEDRGVFGMEREEVRDFYEAARAKDAELIQKLVDAMAYRMSHRFGEEQFREMYYAGGGVSPSKALAIADAAGFKPSTP
jgi:2-polyprenyl-6-methoxyphenol hydroxylase-like FAD-dependent oxidoreductase